MSGETYYSKLAQMEADLRTMAKALLDDGSVHSAQEAIRVLVAVANFRNDTKSDLPFEEIAWGWTPVPEER